MPVRSAPLLGLVLIVAAVSAWLLWRPALAPVTPLASESSSPDAAPSPAELFVTYADVRERVDRPVLEQVAARLRVGLEDDASADVADVAEWVIALCDATRLLGRTEEAIELGQRATELRPADSRAHYLYAKALGEHMRQGGLLTAVRYVGSYKSALARAIELDPQNTAARADRIGFLVFAPGLVGGDIEQARRLAEQLVVDDGRRGALMLALAQMTDGDRTAAIATCRDALQRFPADQDLRVALAGALVDSGRRSEASGHYDEVRTGPRTAAWYRALYLQAQMRVTGAYELDAAVEALRTYAEAQPYGDLMPTVADARWRLGQALERSGQAQAAGVAYREALRLDPDHEDAEQSLADLDRDEG